MQAMIRRINFGVNAEAEIAGYNKMTTILRIHLKDGRTISGRADFAKGSPMIPMSFDDEIAKFLDCAAFAKWLAREHLGFDKRLTLVVYLPGGAPEDEVRLLEVWRKAHPRA